MDNREVAILKTLLYADIFDYPLKEEEIFKFLISPKAIEKRLLFDRLKKSKSKIKLKNRYYFIKGKEDLVKKRIRREKISSGKLVKAKKLIEKINIIPSIKFIGISGALSMKNSDKKDDIDVFVITEKNLVWTTRFFLVILLKLLGSYRDRESKNYSDKICLNMIIDENKMAFNKNNQDLYTAHEIAQIIPVFDKDNTYNKFINLNAWVKKHLPHTTGKKLIYLKRQKNIMENILIIFFRIIFIERILKFIQLRYMKKNITKEIIKDGFLGFHPFDYKSYVLNRYKAKIKNIS